MKDDSPVLLDTHALYWAVESPERLSANVRKLIAGGRAIVSVVSLWELIVKRDRPGAPVANPCEWWSRHVTGRGLRALPIRLRHVAHLEALPPLHKDPFDRMLIAQAATERAPLATCDPAVRSYPIETVW